MRFRSPHSFLEHDGPIPFAHRGGAGDEPENTMPAFEAAVRLGYRYLETDVHLTSDGVVLAFHDDRLDRVTDQRGRIDELPWSEVARARVAGREPIPLLVDLLTAWPGIRLNIDTKSDRVVEPLMRILREHSALDRVCIGSFSDARLSRIRREFGDAVCTSMGPRAVARLRGASFGLGSPAPAGNCLQVPVSARGVPVADARFIRKAHELGYPVHIWTVDEPEEMHRLLDLGADGIMTDRPALLLEVLSSRDDRMDDRGDNGHR